MSACADGFLPQEGVCQVAEIHEAREQLKRFTGPFVDAPSETLKPSRTGIVNCEVSGDAYVGESRGSDGRAERQLRVKIS